MKWQELAILLLDDVTAVLWVNLNCVDHEWPLFIDDCVILDQHFVPAPLFLPELSGSLTVALDKNSFTYHQFWLSQMDGWRRREHKLFLLAVQIVHLDIVQLDLFLMMMMMRVTVIILIFIPVKYWRHCCKMAAARARSGLLLFLMINWAFISCIVKST